MRKLVFSLITTAFFSATSAYAKSPVCNVNLSPALAGKIQAVELSAPGVLDVCISDGEQMLFLESASDGALNIEPKESFGVVFFSSRGESVTPTKVILYTLNRGGIVSRKDALNRYELMVTATSLADQYRLRSVKTDSFSARLVAAATSLQDQNRLRGIEPGSFFNQLVKTPPP